VPPVTHTHALFADQSHSIPDNLVALLGAIRAWHCSPKLRPVLGRMQDQQLRFQITDAQTSAIFTTPDRGQAVRGVSVLTQDRQSARVRGMTAAGMDCRPSRVPSRTARLRRNRPLAENRLRSVVSLKPTFAIRLPRARGSARRLLLVTRPCGAINDPGMIDQGG
jgi:hypothetical protein